MTGSANTNCINKIIKHIEQNYVVIFISRRYVILSVFIDFSQCRALIDAHRLTWRRHLIIYAVGQQPPSLSHVLVFLTGTLVGEALHPSVDILCQRVVPSLFEHIFIHERVAVEAFQCASDAHEVVAASFKSVLDAFVHYIQIASQH